MCFFRGGGIGTGAGCRLDLGQPAAKAIARLIVSPLSPDCRQRSHCPPLLVTSSLCMHVAKSAKSKDYTILRQLQALGATLKGKEGAVWSSGLPCGSLLPCGRHPGRSSPCCPCSTAFFRLLTRHAQRTAMACVCSRHIQFSFQLQFQVCLESAVVLCIRLAFTLCLSCCILCG